jgi:hypothetical protein
MGMTVRELRCWPPKWRRVPGGTGPVANGEDGILIAVRCDLRNQSLTLTREDETDRRFAVLEDEMSLLTRLSLLLDWQIGRPLAKIGSLEMTP